jgi:hypothetical protein
MQDKEDNRFDEWDNFTDMDLAEMWFDSRGIDNRRTKLYNGEWVVIVSLESGGMELDVILHEAELEERANEWRYESE